MSSVNELKEAIAFGFGVAKIIKGRLADGYQKEDLLGIVEDLTSDENLEALKLALDGASEIPAEAKEIGLFEGIELARFTIAQIKTLG